ncbi:MAG: hypothetical protein PWQ17_2157, partial [Anaerophaga sp.]|nr:hypothetical protein [Anaerophaga sp.]MDN5292228.1 hypothetical protein [Anaerophaga sp.]
PFLPLTPKGELLKISSLKKSPLGDLGVKRLFRPGSGVLDDFFATPDLWEYKKNTNLVRFIF